MTPRFLELILLCSRTIPVFRLQRNMNVVFSANSNVASLQWAERWYIKKGKFRLSNSSKDLEALITYYNKRTGHPFCK
jgi:hypothetical protein